MSLFPKISDMWLRDVVANVSMLTDCHSGDSGIAFRIIVKSAPRPLINYFKT